MNLKVPKDLNMKWQKDIFIDVQIANKFAKPPNDHYKALLRALLLIDKENPDNNLVLVLSDKLINKYISGNQLSQQVTSIGVLLDQFISSKRFNSVGSEICKQFKKRYVDKGHNVNFKGLNLEDKFLFPLIFYSNRKIGIIEDNKFREIASNFPPFSKNVVIKDCPSLLLDKF